MLVPGIGEGRFCYGFQKGESRNRSEVLTGDDNRRGLQGLLPTDYPVDGCFVFERIFDWEDCGIEVIV